jgi:hypothetical protein
MTSPANHTTEHKSAQQLPNGRLHGRPKTVETCPQCGAFVGRSYPACAYCYQAVERLWQPEWEMQLHAEGAAPGSEEEEMLAAIVMSQPDRFVWTVVDVAITRLRCASCGSPLGTSAPGCWECTSASDSLWGVPDGEAPGTGAAPGNSHALRVIRWQLRQPHRHSEQALAGFRLYLPILLTGLLPTVKQNQALKAWANAGHGAELASCRSFDEMYAHTRQGRK